MNTTNDSKKYPSSVTVFIEIHAKDGEEEFARKAFMTTIATTEKPGLLSYEIFEDSNYPGTFYSTQEWENIEAFHAHMSAAKSGLKEATAMLRDAPRTSILKRIGQSAH
ncbi:antibiotic biosynthesis monooxygenase [Desulfosporosinus fructosivorans]|uniref:Antibiotic biosynthesis monooxygenase n=1 Tax=Desulfosporosinus fructosivorans TaxID=2018669 RepID=A0A4Z0QY66_9FIRM|nr:antibiotic biosynthesis monooxygenase [Desulfosporosinus fructosivorans]TGE35360.1 antibiotic biosynthesis monooxygenase [Desulfosporosinus fructosivorans]